MADDLDRELRAHIENEADDLRERGMSADEARQAARRALGSETIIREDVRALSPWAALDDAAQDLRYGARILRKQPGFAIVAALTLALGIGATTTIFSVVEAVLLRPLPYADADRLVTVWENVNLPAYKNAQNTPSPGNFRDWRAQNSTFVDLAAMRDGAWSLTGSGEPVRVSGEMVSASLLTLLQVEPALGRNFTAEEDAAAPSRVVLLGHGLWVERFGSNPSIVGQTIRLDDEPYTVAGVMPAGFRFPDADDQLWLPLNLTAQELQNHGSHFLRVVGRLKPGVTAAQAQSDIETICARLTKEYPNSNTGVGASVVSLPEYVVGNVRRPLLVILGVVGLLLLMVCANIGNLQLARASARAREFAVRAALGARRTRLVRQLLTESLLLAVIGGGLGLALAWWGVGTLRWLAPTDLPRVNDIAVNATAAVFTLVVALAAGIACGLMPAVQVRHDLHDALKDDTRASATPGRVRARSLLVVAETALGVVVLVGAGLLLRSFVGLMQVPVGFRSEGVLTFRVSVPAARYPTEPQRTAFYQRMVERLQALPGVTSAAGISFLPLTMAGRTTAVTVEGEAAQSSAQLKFVDFRSATPGYFKAMSIPMLAGRDVAWSDTETAPTVIVISETMARTFWPGSGSAGIKDAIGKRIKPGRVQDPTPWLTVVGIVGDVHQLDLVRQPRPAIYIPAAQATATRDTLRDWVVRTATEPASLAPAVRAAVWSIDPSLPITRTQTMEQLRAAFTASQQFTLLLVGLFAMLALILAAVGLYGVTAYNVSQRTRELGIRVALGARRTTLLRLVLGQGASLTIAGVAHGSLI